MTAPEQTSIDFNNLVQKMDNIEAELEIQSNYLGTIKMLLTLLVIIMLPIVLFVIYVFYLMNNPRFYL